LPDFRARYLISRCAANRSPANTCGKKDSSFFIIFVIPANL